MTSRKFQNHENCTDILKEIVEEINTDTVEEGETDDFEQPLFPDSHKKLLFEKTLKQTKLSHNMFQKKTGCSKMDKERKKQLKETASDLMQ